MQKTGKKQPEEWQKKYTQKDITKENSRKMIQEKFGYFREAIRQNFIALENLANVQLSYEEHSTISPESYFLQTAGSVERMITAYARIADLSEEQEQQFKQKLAEVKKKGANSTRTLSFVKKFGYQETSIERKNLKELFNDVIIITKPIRNPTNPEFTLENVGTIHDLIRYVHQKSIDSIFNVKTGEGEKRTQSLTRTSFEIVDTDGTSTRNQTLQEIIQEYERICEHKPGSECIRIISADNYINAHLALGCHSADLSAMLDGSGSFVDLKYKESGCSGSPQRQQYLAKVLELYDFKVSINGGILEAKLRDRVEGTAKKALRTVSRLLASSKDLDIIGTIPLDYAVGFFKAGGVNTQRAVKLKRKIDETIKEERTSEEALAWLEHSIKTDLQKVIPEAKNFVLNYAVEQFETKHGKTNVQEVLEQEEFVTEKPEGFKEYSLGNSGILFEFFNKLFNSNKPFGQLLPQVKEEESSIIENPIDITYPGLSSLFENSFIKTKTPNLEDILLNSNSPSH